MEILRRNLQEIPSQCGPIRDTLDISHTKNPGIVLDLKSPESTFKAVHGKAPQGGLCMKFYRYLVVDILEDRRLLAGLDVHVFEDPLSSRLPGDTSVPASERVVYLDINADGTQQASEPIGISDFDGIARFRNLEQGTYYVRLLGSSKSQVQTTDTVPAAAGSWTGDVGAWKSLLWQTDSVGWFATSESLIQLDLDRSTILGRLSMPGRLISVEMQSDSQGVALVSLPSSKTQLVGFDLTLGQIRNLGSSLNLQQGPASDASSDVGLIRIANSTFLRRATPSGDELVRVPPIETWDNNPEFTSVANRIAPNAQMVAFGNDSLIIREPMLDGYIISVWKYSEESLELIAQRDFDFSVQLVAGSPDSKQIAVETGRGIEILSTSTGLPTQLVLQQAKGPLVFDLGRGILWSLSKSNTSRLIGWTIAEGSKAFDVLFTDSGTPENASRTNLQLGFRGDTLVGFRDGQIYRHVLSIAKATVATLSDQVIQQVAIGIRNRSQNNPPLLHALPGVQATEDKPAAIQISQWSDSSGDSDGDSLHYILVRDGQLGSVSWSTSSGGVYTPKPDANGQDQIIVQAYDGRSWSAPQTVSIQIQPVNDPPQGLLYSGVLAIPENQPGYVLGSLSIVDPDANEVFDYSVSDGRFEVVGNTLKVRDSAMIPYQNPGWIDLSFQARSRTNGETIERPERIFIVRDQTPYHNDSNPADVDGDGVVTPLDPLIIIDYLNRNGSGQITPPGEGEARNDLDVDGDGQVSPLDILIVINALNHAFSEAEGENGTSDSSGDSGMGDSGTLAPLDPEDPLGLRKAKR